MNQSLWNKIKILWIRNESCIDMQPYVLAKKNETGNKIRTDLDGVAESIASIFEPRLLLCLWRADGICNLKALKMSLPTNALSTSLCLQKI